MVARTTAAIAALTFFAFVASANAASRAAVFENGPRADTVRTKLQHPDGTNISGKTVVASSSSLVKTATLAQALSASTLGQNLIQNPGFESTGTNGLPTNWLKGGYGTNTRTLTYPVAGNASAKGAQVSITSYTSGDAKWYFPNIPVTGGATYQFSDYSMANVPTIVDVQYTMKDGTFTYADIATVPASNSYQKTTAQFTAPANAASVMIFHVLNRVGALSVDDYSLQEVTNTPPPTNLVPNGTLENGATTPTGWKSSHWGTNTATFTYPAVAGDGSRAVKTTISGYTNGDAKWYFTPLTLTAGTYTYSDQYSSNIPSAVTVQLQNADGTFSYKDIATLGATNGFASVRADFTVPSGTQNVTVFHLIKNNGSLTVDNVSVVKKSALSGVFLTGAVTLRFDDAWLSQYQNALPNMQSAGINGTFYIVTKQLPDNGFPAYMSKAQVQDLYAKGMEIGAHTRTHPDLSTLSATAAQAEIQGSRSDLLSWGVGPINSFSYPFGAYTATTLQIVKNAGFSSAAATITGDVVPTSDPYQLEHHEITDATTLAEVQSWIDEAIAKKLWLIITIHEVNTTCNAYCVSPTRFNQIVDYLTSKKVPVVTISQGLQSLQ